MAIDLAKYQNEGKYPRTFILFYNPLYIRLMESGFLQGKEYKDRIG
jgi:hypothetical protein